MSTLTVNQKYTGEVLQTLQMHTQDEVQSMLNLAIEKQHNILPSYKRIEILRNIITLMKESSEELARIIADEGGKPLKDTKVEVARAIDGVDLAITGVRNIRGSQIPMDLTEAGAGRLAFTIPEPIGVVVAVSAFNHPLNLAVHQVIPAIATGCPVIIKPASATPLSALKLAQIAKEAGLPEGYLQVAIVDNTVGEFLVTHPKIAFFSFIGSAHIGWMLKSKLAPGVRCALEHGGVAPLILDEYHNTDNFIMGLAKAAFYHSGQVCVSVQRVYVPKHISKEICDKLTNVASELVIGDAALEETDLGPIINKKEVLRVKTWIDEALAQGAVLITGGKIANEVCIEPTILLNPSKTSKVSTGEIFGPVVCIYEYDDIENAITEANSLDVSFQSSIFSDNIHVAMSTAKKLAASSVLVNDYTTFRVDWMPFTGRKHSGYGIGGIEHTMKNMIEEKMIAIKE